MKLEDRVCSMELAKKLNELKVKRSQFEDTWWWTEFYNTSSTTPDTLFSTLVSYDKLEEMRERSYLKELRAYSAFTVAELGEMLGRYVDSIVLSERPPWELYNPETHRRLPAYMQIELREANARAVYLVYLIENGLVKVEDLP